MKGYLIEKYSDMGGAYTVNRIIEEATKAGVQLDVIGVSDCYIWENKVYHNEVQVKPRDFVINRYKYGFLVDKINNLCKKTYNDNKSFKCYVNKYTQISELDMQECMVPRFLLANIDIDYLSIVSRIGSPFVAKGLDGSQGKEVFLINNLVEYTNLKQRYSSKDELLYEEFIEESKGHDIRVYSIRGEAVACMLRSNESDFRANVARGANVEQYPINNKIRAITQEIYEKTKLDFLGIDLLLSKEGYYFCEINVMAGIEGIERATGINVARLIIDRIRSDFRGY